MKKTQELTLTIEDLEERIAPHIVITPADQASENAQPEAHPHAAVHASLGPGAEDWRIHTPGHENP